MGLHLYAYLNQEKDQYFMHREKTCHCNFSSWNISRLIIKSNRYFHKDTAITAAASYFCASWLLIMSPTKKRCTAVGMGLHLYAYLSKENDQFFMHTGKTCHCNFSSWNITRFIIRSFFDLKVVLHSFEQRAILHIFVFVLFLSGLSNWNRLQLVFPSKTHQLLLLLLTFARHSCFPCLLKETDAQLFVTILGSFSCQWILWFLFSVYLKLSSHNSFQVQFGSTGWGIQK